MNESLNHSEFLEDDCITAELFDMNRDVNNLVKEVDELQKSDKCIQASLSEITNLVSGCEDRKSTLANELKVLESELSRLPEFVNDVDEQMQNDSKLVTAKYAVYYG